MHAIEPTTTARDGARIGRRFGSCARGSVYVESLITIPVLLFFFFGMVQLSYLCIASLLTRHAAVQAARAAAVLIPDCPSAFADNSPPGTTTGSRWTEVQQAAFGVVEAVDNLPLLWTTGSGGVSLNDVNVDLQLGSGLMSPTVVTVTFQPPCTVPVDGWLICTAVGGGKVHGVAAFPNQGAGYVYY